MLRVEALFVVCLSLLPLVLASGCATSSESASADTLTADVGKYPPPPPNLELKRAAVPSFLDATKGKGGSSSEKLGTLAADQLTTLLVNAERFNMIERAQLEQLLKEQDLEGIVDPNELAQPGKVRGVDYLVIGKITNFRVKAEKSETGFGLAKVGNVLGGVDVKNQSTEIKVDVGVDLRVVDPTSGAIVAADFGEYQKTDTVGAFGLEILGANATAAGDLKIDEDNQGKLLRLALDHCIKKMLPKLDRKLLKRQAAAEK
jgi:curli biogenesis system outer membrane secretion channel CsgG